ncbi:mycofactocin biosynthesis glycosyltransferase MftF [Dermacoccaceae bacterium W4C1]
MSESRTRADLPYGFQIRLSEDTHRCSDGTTLYGGSGHIVRLRPEASRRLREGALCVHDPTSATLARLLLDRGLAQPFWPDRATGAPAGTLQLTLADVTVVIPVRDRTDGVRTALGSLPAVARILLVDDGSRDPQALRTLVEGCGADLLRHPVSCGPAAARNTGLAQVRTPLVLFVDSDVQLAPDCLDLLLRHFVDPSVAAVAPRVLGEDEGEGVLARYEAAHSSLDMGPAPARVSPGTRVPYVPSAVLLARAPALGDGFDAAMPVAEDVDLIWRLAAQHTVRYDPRAHARHTHRTQPRAWFSRKCAYGTGAALLAARHGDAVAPAVLSPWSAVVTGCALAQSRWSLPVAAIATVAAQQSLARRLTFSATPQRSSIRLMAMAIRGTAGQTSSAVTRHYVPVVLVAATRSRRARRAYLLATLAGGVLDHRRTHSRLGVAGHVGLHALDDLAYGIGLWSGALRARSLDALTPRFRGRTAAR